MQGDGSSYVLVVASYGGHAASVVVVVSYTWRKGNINIITCTDKITKQAYQEVNAKKGSMCNYIKEQIEHYHLSIISGADRTLSWTPLYYLRGR